MRALTWVLHVLHHPVHGRLYPAVVCVEHGLLTRLHREAHLHQLEDNTLIQLHLWIPKAIKSYTGKIDVIQITFILLHLFLTSWVKINNFAI